jgi:hypothetical protein
MNCSRKLAPDLDFDLAFFCFVPLASRGGALRSTELDAESSELSDVRCTENGAMSPPGIAAAAFLDLGPETAELHP